MRQSRDMGYLNAEEDGSCPVPTTLFASGFSFRNPWSRQRVNEFLVIRAPWRQVASTVLKKSRRACATWSGASRAA